MTSSVINTYKVVLLGEGRVGKTSILLRYAESSYVEGRSPTLQASYVEKHIVIDDSSDIEFSSSLDPSLLKPCKGRREAKLSIWDTAGQERFHSLGPIYYRNAHGAILVYDITDRHSFERVQKWTRELRKMVGNKTKICLIIVGNKLDLSRQRSVEAEEAQNYANSVDANFIEVSAKAGTGIEDVFIKITSVMIDTIGQSASMVATSTIANASAAMRRTTNLMNNNSVILSNDKQSAAPYTKCC
ncbi:hypothetical protein HJC23_007593 [Cyclotella cryptica]|uniref:Ras-related protein Rab-21 n=1 Tax=Cyclotella cryptica TaxID=29204 RepID=A0ABD3QSE9_9STRA|eukprot:CCRYP_002881-RB/>CCRYP_002881-RB protein AED:0.10 eAED:0.10 QI:239/1/1/1/0.4/0.33/6/3512/243